MIAVFHILVLSDSGSHEPHLRLIVIMCSRTSRDFAPPLDSPEGSTGSLFIIYHSHFIVYIVINPTASYMAYFIKINKNKNRDGPNKD